MLTIEEKQAFIKKAKAVHESGADEGFYISKDNPLNKWVLDVTGRDWDSIWIYEEPKYIDMLEKDVETYVITDNTLENQPAICWKPLNPSDKQLEYHSIENPQKSVITRKALQILIAEEICCEPSLLNLIAEGKITIE